MTGQVTGNIQTKTNPELSYSEKNTSTNQVKITDIQKASVTANSITTTFKCAVH